MPTSFNKRFIKQFLFWISLFGIIVVYTKYERLGLPDARGIGGKDDQSLALFFLALITLLISFKHFFAKFSVAVVSLVLTFFAIINWWFYDFYRDYLTFSIYKLAAYTEETSMAWGGLKYKQEALIFIVLMLVLLTILIKLSRYQPKKQIVRFVALLALILGLQQQYLVLTRSGGGLQLKGVNPVSYFIKSMFDKPDLEITEEHINSLKEALNKSDIGLASQQFPLFEQVQIKHIIKPKNVILVVLESVRTLETGLYADDAESIAPNLKKLSQESLNFTNSYANSNQTVRSEVAMLCSALDYINGSPYSASGNAIKTNCLPSILKQNGYDTFWIHGYKKRFFNRGEFFPKLGFTHLLDKSEINPDDLKPKIGWGVSDEVLFDFALDRLEQSKKPFFAEILTLSNHYPYLWDWGIEFPKNLQLETKLEEGKDNIYPEYRRGIHYTDYAFGLFLERFKKSDLYDNTLLIVTGDHGIWTFSDDMLKTKGIENELKKGETYFRVPLLLHAKDISAKGIKTPVSHVDIAPTVLDYLGISYPNAFMGSSLLHLNSSNTKPVYYLAAGSYGFRDGDQYCYPIDTTDVCNNYHRICDNYIQKEDESACVVQQGDLLLSTDSLTAINVDRTNQHSFIDLSQHFLNKGFMPDQYLIEQ